MPGFWAFCWNRRAFIATYAGFGLVILIVVQLDLSLSHSGLQVVNMLYLVLLGLVGLMFFLMYDYRRWVVFLRWLQEVDASRPLDELAVPPPGQTLEQKTYAQAWATLYSRLRAEVVREEQRGRSNIELISRWAHHMKTPVAVIDLELQKARKQEWYAACEAVLNSVAEENLRLQQSLQSLLNMVRLEDFNADFVVEPVDLDVLVHRVVNDHKREFIMHQVYPKVKFADQPVEASPGLSGTGTSSASSASSASSGYIVQSDAKWLQFILEQVMSNAIKYSTDTGREGWVCFRGYRDGADTVLEVADNGIGIAPEDVKRVFAPFYTGNTGRHYAQSTGMGLYLAKEACRRLGHVISLESHLGEGTQVTLRFPAALTTHSDLHLS